jgi:hypothetical protein
MTTAKVISRTSGQRDRNYCEDDCKDVTHVPSLSQLVSGITFAFQPRRLMMSHAGDGCKRRLGRT